MPRILDLFRGRQDLVLVGLLMVTILVMIVPLPTVLVDVLLAVNIGFTLHVLIVSIYLKRPEDFSSFPAIILLATTFRLAITISTTRLILSQGDAGAVIDTFGNFVTRGSVLVGLVVFLIITTVQFIVITKGAERVAEVAARFTLDGLPGRQMSIDAELRNGDIDAATAQRKRGQLEKENQFFGAMDGAMKFVKGDAIAGLIIVAINLVGGLVVGVVVNDMPFEAALNLYSRLTVGDGLVGQIPALIVAMCAGTIITRVNSGKNLDLGSDIIDQLTSGPKALYVAGTLIALIGLVPGLPTTIFVTLGLFLAGTGWFLGRKQEAGDDIPGIGNSGRIEGKNFTARRGADVSIASVPGNIVSIRLGERAFAAIDPAVFAQERAVRLEELDNRLGVRLPGFGVEKDSLAGEDEVCFVLDGVPGISTLLRPRMLIAVGEGSIFQIAGVNAEPVDKAWPVTSAWWIDQANATDLSSAGLEILTPTQLVVRSVARFMLQNVSRIVGYQHVQLIVRELGAEHDQLASQISQSISAVQLLGLFRRLLSEGVPLRPRRILFEALLEAAVTATSAEHLVRSARAALSRQICATLADEDGLISGYVLEPDLDLLMRESVVRAGDEPVLRLPPATAAALLDEASAALRNREPGTPAPVILTAEDLRWALASYLRSNGLEAQVMAYNEITSEFTFVPVATLGAGSANGGVADNGLAA